MTFTDDILKKINKDYDHNANKVLQIMEENISKYNHINHPRIVRSILFLSESDINKLRNYIKIAISDPRDILYAAEYEPSNDMNSKRIRDFNTPFDVAEN